MFQDVAGTDREVEMGAEPHTRVVARQARSVATFERIVEAAGTLLDEIGADATTMDAIAQRAGVSIGSVYRFFENKSALWSTIEARWRDRMWETMKPQFAEDGPERDIETAADEFVAGLRKVLDELPGAKGMLAMSLRREPPEDNAALWAEYLERFIATHAPNLPPARRTVAAYTYQTITSALILSAVHVVGPERESHLTEIRTVLVGYTRELGREGAARPPAAEHPAGEEPPAPA